MYESERQVIQTVYIIIIFIYNLVLKLLTGFVNKRFGERYFLAIYNALKNGHVKWVVMPNFKDKAKKGILQSIKKSAGIFNGANPNAKVQIMPLAFMEAASRIFCLHLELLSSSKVSNKLLGDYCLKEVMAHLAKEFPFLCIGLDKNDFLSDPIFSPSSMPITGVFGPQDDSNEALFIPDAQLSIEDGLVRQMLPLWQSSSNPKSDFELTVCGKKTKLTSYYFIDPLNSHLHVVNDRSPTQKSNLNYIEPAYLFKDKLLRYF